MTSENDTTDERVGLVLRDKWRLERLLGVGGMASVYLARHEIGRYDAIKILHDQYADDDAIRARFEREAHAVNHFRHPGAVEIRDIDATDDGCPFLVMEYLVGEPLQDRIKHEELPLQDVLGIVIDVLDVLGAAHDQGIIHRDIKPANVFVLEDGRVKVLDFGIARMREAAGKRALTEEGMTLGTGGYMPPEQIVGEAIDLRADLFAVGATMFRIIAGRPVQRAASYSELLVKMATEPAPRLASVAPDAADDLCKVVDRALAFDPDDRYPDAPTMQRDVRALRQGEPPPYVTAILRGDREAAELAQTAARAGRDSSSRGGKSGPRGRQRMSSAQRMTGRVVNGRYRIDKLIGKGGMGAVYQAHDEETGRRVAVKLVLAHLAHDDSSTPGRFRREAQAAGAIDDDHVVKVLDANVDEQGTPFLVMDLLEGRDLERLLEQVRPIPQPAAVRLFVQACRGIAAAHARDIVHRDIKPGNLFLSQQANGRVVVKVLDFGLAKQRSREGASAQASLTETGGVLGTPRYASPEQVKNAKLIDKRSDVWSLCMTMYEALSGLVPWNECEAVGEIIITIATTDVAPLREVAPWIDAELAAIIDRGLSREPSARWPDAAALRDALAALVPDTHLEVSMLVGRDMGSTSFRPSPRPSGLPSSRSVPGVDTDYMLTPRPRRAPVLVALAAVAVGAALGLAALRDPAPEDTAPLAPAASGPITEPSPSMTAEHDASESDLAVDTSAPADTAASQAPAKHGAAPKPRLPSPAAPPSPTAPKPAATTPPAPAPKLELKTEW